MPPSRKQPKPRKHRAPDPSELGLERLWRELNKGKVQTRPAALTARESAERLGISDRTMRRRLSDGRVPGAVKTQPNRWAIPDGALTARVAVPHPPAALPEPPAPAPEPTPYAGLTEVEALRLQIEMQRAHIASLEALLTVYGHPHRA